MKLKDPDNLLYLGLGCIVAAAWLYGLTLGLIITGLMLICAAFIMHIDMKNRRK